MTSYYRENSMNSMSTLTRTSSLFSYSEDEDESAIFAYSRSDYQNFEYDPVSYNKLNHNVTIKKGQVQGSSIYHDDEELDQTTKAIMITTYIPTHYENESFTELNAGPLNKQSVQWKNAYTCYNHSQESFEYEESEKEEEVEIAETYDDLFEPPHVPSRDPNLSYHIRLATHDGSFRAILKKDEHTTTEQIITILQKKYNLGKNLLLSLEEHQVEGDNYVLKYLKPSDLIMKIQNDLLMMHHGFDTMEELAKCCLDKDNQFKFIVHVV